MAKITDKNMLVRTAQPLVIEARRCDGSGFAADWQIIDGAVVEEIEINHGAKPNQAVIRFAEYRFDQPLPIHFGWQIRITTDQDKDFTVLFQGFAAEYLPSFAAGDGDSREEVAVRCLDYRWFLMRTCPVFGQYARSVDDFEGASPKNAMTFFSGRHLIFNAEGLPNRDPVFNAVNSAISGYRSATIPVFSDKSRAEHWTAGQMISYLMTPYYNRYFHIFPLLPVDCVGLDHADFSRVIHSISCEGLTLTEAVEKICKNIGFSFREDYTESGPRWVFYKPGNAAGAVRGGAAQTILHTLHAPAVNDKLTAAVAAGSKMVYASNYAQSIDSVVNNPWGLGDVHTFEITVPLVPGWQDSDLTLDSASSYANLFKTDADLGGETNPNQYSYFQRYHARGSSFQRDIGRKWVLNELGLYTGGSYDRGSAFDFASVIPAEYIKDKATGRRLFGPFARSFKPCLTFDKDSLNTVGVKVEFSFNSGSTWQVLPVTVENLSSECGIRITSQNLAELVDLAKGTIASGDLSGKELNYFTSLADDKVNSRVFKTGGWKTRVRITACIEMDNRLVKDSRPSGKSGSPFLQAQIYRMTDKYTFSRRTPSSAYYGSNLPAWETDESKKLYDHLDGIRQANEDMSINGRFTLDRLWLGDGSGTPDFAVGDGIEGIAGRTRFFAQQVAGRTVYPEIIQMTYRIPQQKQILITRDLRLAETA